MLFAKNEITPVHVFVYLTTLATLMLDVDRNVLPIQIVQKIKLAAIINVLIPAQEFVVEMLNAVL
jgi:hypothetical protein